MKNLKNSTTPRIFIAATRQNDGKTTASLGLLAAFRKTNLRVGYIKPIGQRFVEVHQMKVDEDTVLMDRVYGLNCPLNEMSPIAVGRDFTRSYLQNAHRNSLAERVQRAFDRVAWEKDLVVCEGSGHAGVGSVVDLSNAQVAKLVGAKVVIVTRGGIGKPIDEIALNQALFEKEQVEIIGVILNKVIPEKVDEIREPASKGLSRRGLKLLGVVPHANLLSYPTMDLIREELDADAINGTQHIHRTVEKVVVGAMSAHHAGRYLSRGAMLIVPGDRDDLIETLLDDSRRDLCSTLAGIVLTDGIRPAERLFCKMEQLSCPVVLAEDDCYRVTTRVRDVIVKTRPDDSAKISLIRDLINTHVDVSQILQAIT